MIKSRNRNIVIRSQFNINGSRGKDAGKFIAQYVSRESATDPSTAYVPDPNQIPQPGDGVAFTIDKTAITRHETLDVAEHVQSLHQTGVRAIQQMVISLDHDYLIDHHIVPEDTVIFHKGDYRDQYDDVRLRHAVQHGLQSLIDAEGYRNGKAIACIQRDTLHLHVHAVVYEDAKKISRLRGREEKGVIKKSSFNQMAYDINRNLNLTQTAGLIPTKANLMVKDKLDKPITKHIVPDEPIVESSYIDAYLQLLQQQALKLEHKIIDEQGQIQDESEQEAAIDEHDKQMKEVRQKEDSEQLQEDDSETEQTPYQL